VADSVTARALRWAGIAPQVRLLLTARRPLQVPGEVVVELGPLSADDAMELFARAAPRPITKAERGTVAKLVRRLDHHPLAIELAAARTNLLKPSELLERLDDRFALLTDAAGDALEAVIAWSWDQLQPWSRHALLQLAVFRGTFLVQAAESVVDVSQWPDAPWPLDVIDDLWRRSLLYVRHTNKGPRLGMFESVRVYVLHRAGPASEPARQSAEARHGEWYARQGTPAALDALHTSTGNSRHRELSKALEDLVAALERSSAVANSEVAEATGLAAAEVLARSGPKARAREVLGTVLAIDDLQRRDHALCLLLAVDESLSLDHRKRLWAEAVAAAPTHRRRAKVEALAARDRAAFEPEAAVPMCTVHWPVRAKPASTSPSPSR
jgi:predicted ATPase